MCCLPLKDINPNAILPFFFKLCTHKKETADRSGAGLAGGRARAARQVAARAQLPAPAGASPAGIGARTVVGVEVAILVVVWSWGCWGHRGPGTTTSRGVANDAGEPPRVPHLSLQRTPSTSLRTMALRTHLSSLPSGRGGDGSATPG